MSEKRKNRILIVIILMNIITIYPLYSLATLNNIDNTSEYNKYKNLDIDNSKGTSYWKNVPLVSKELLDKEEVTIGGEGGELSLCLTASSDEKYMFYGTDVGGIYRSDDSGKNLAEKTWKLYFCRSIRYNSRS